MPREFIQELRGDVRREAIDIYDHIDKKELKESYMAHIPQLGISSTLPAIEISVMANLQGAQVDYPDPFIMSRIEVLPDFKHGTYRGLWACAILLDVFRDFIDLRLEWGPLKNECARFEIRFVIRFSTS